MHKKNVLVLFGGRSGEHEIAIRSAKSIVDAIDPKTHQITLVGVAKDGVFYFCAEQNFKVVFEELSLKTIKEEKNILTLLPYQVKESPLRFLNIDADQNILPKNIDVIIPVLHGPNGEDGTMQGLLELAQIPYVGSTVLSSSLCMDKDITKRILRDAGIPIVPYHMTDKKSFTKDTEAELTKFEKDFSYPYFVKPTNLGSSVGVYKIKSRAEAKEKILAALDYDTSVLIEQGIDAREIECAILGNLDIEASPLGEIVPLGDFYSYEAKYIDKTGADLHIPARSLNDKQIAQIQEYAKKAFLACKCRGLARVDFFLSRKDAKIYLNEINTFPGFTSISQYPKLWEITGLKMDKLIEKLLDLAIEENLLKKSLKI